MKRITEVSLSCLPYSARYVPANRPSGAPMPTPITVIMIEPMMALRKPAVGRSRRRRILGKDREIDAGEAVVEQREQDQREPGHAEQRGSQAQELDDDIVAAAG